MKAIDSEQNIDKGHRKVVFILSETRSGSTWLSYVLGSHTDAVHLGEYYKPFTLPNHTACRLCEAKGRTECEFLYGIDKVKKEQAYDFAFERFRKSTLIDCSKQLDWLANFVSQKTFQIKTIHLIRDPRAWYASEKRRDQKLTVNDAMKRWVNRNQFINLKINELSISHVTVFYDELCVAPDLYFPNSLSGYLDMPYEKDAIKYWKFEHHGLGGNGAAYNNLMNYPQAKILTGDDEFYQKMQKKHFYDSRWLKELTSLERTSIETMDIVNEYLNQHTRNFAHFDKLLGKIND